MDLAFQQAVEARRLTVGVVGLGYVGLPLALAFQEAGFRVLGLDTDPSKVAKLEAGESYLGHIPRPAIQTLGASETFSATSDFERAAEADALLLCVPTPLTRNREPDMSFVVATAEAIAPHLKPGALVALESTTYPGTTRGVMLPLLEAQGGREGRDFYLAYSPEREDPGNRDYTTGRIPKVVGGCSNEAAARAACLYAAVTPHIVPVSSAETAEAVKLTENIFRAVNIALVNELKVVFTEMGIDVWEVIEAAKTKPFGYMPFYPGPGLGGHCIPIDPFYLTWKAREFGCVTRFVELAGEVNLSMPGYVLTRLTEALNERGQALKGSRILILGVAYKPDVDDLRESPALVLLERLLARGAAAEYHDPHVPRIKPTRRHAMLEGMESVPLTPGRLEACDAVLIATDHRCVDYAEVVRRAPLIVDTRNVTDGLPEAAAKVVKA